ncbi:hypothetical protein ABIB62_001513 [Mucilaginibacter sp. UYP25]|uniref:hypothetical protein n=2 Tax=unclassified Mucilaginibacter TaxID=2617802 RepID=UPI0033969C6C
MTTVIIQSNSDKKTTLLMQLAEELGLHAETSEIKELSEADMVTGIGRNATDAELEIYLNKGLNEEPIDLNTVLSNYINRK